MEEFELKNRIKQVRKKKRITQKELAVLIGVSRQTINSIENGQINPSAKLALKICMTLNKSFEELFFPK